MILTEETVSKDVEKDNNINNNNSQILTPTIVSLFSQEQMEKIRVKTPPKELESYVTYNGQDVELTGVKWPYFKNLLNEIIGVGNWYVDIDVPNIRYEKIGDNFSCSVPVRCYITEQVIATWANAKGFITRWTYQTIGSAYFKNKALYGDLVKAAQTDGTKKCFSMLGFCDDVYSGETKLVVNKSNMRPPRSGKFEFTEEEKVKVKEIKNQIQTLIKKCVTMVKRKQAANKILTNEEKSLLIFTKDDLLKMANESLIIAVSNNDCNFNINEGIYSYSDIHTLHEWEIFKAFMEKNFNKFLVDNNNNTTTTVAMS